MLKKFGCPADANVHNATVLDVEDLNKLGKDNDEEENNRKGSNKE